MLVEVGGSGDDALYFQIEGKDALEIKKLGSLILGEVSNHYKTYVSTMDDYCLITDGNHEAEEEKTSKTKVNASLFSRMKSVVDRVQKNNLF